MNFYVLDFLVLKGLLISSTKKTWCVNGEPIPQNSHIISEIICVPFSCCATI